MKNFFLGCAQLLFFSSLMSMEQAHTINIEQNIDEYVQQIKISPISILPEEIHGEILYETAQDKPFDEIQKNALVCKYWEAQTKNNNKIKKLTQDIKSYNMETKQFIVQIGCYNKFIDNISDQRAQIMAIQRMCHPFFYSSFKFKDGGYANILIHHGLSSVLNSFLERGGTLPLLSFAECQHICNTQLDSSIIATLAKYNYDFASTDMLSCAIQATQPLFILLILSNCNVNKRTNGITPLLDALLTIISNQQIGSRHLIYPMIRGLLCAGADQTATAKIGDYVISKDILLASIKNVELKQSLQAIFDEYNNQLIQ